MSRDRPDAPDDALDLGVYLALLALTGATVAASLLARDSRLMAVSFALIIAMTKAGLIGFYYMGLRRERPLTFAILGVGALAVLTLLAGLLPDMTFRRF